MKSLFILLLLLVSALHAQDTTEITLPPTENPHIRPIGPAIAAVGTGAASIFCLVYGSYRWNHPALTVGADFDAALLLFALPLAIGSGVMTGITVQMYKRWKEWEQQYGMDVDFSYDVTASRYTVLFEMNIPHP